MAVKEIPDGEHFVRHIEGTRIQRNDDGRVVGIFPEAMSLRMLRSGPEEDLSGTYLEHFEGTPETQLRGACNVLKARLKTRFGSLDGLGVMEAANIRAVGRARERKLRVLHEPKRGRLDKASIRGLPIPPDIDVELCAMLAAIALSGVRDVAEFAS